MQEPTITIMGLGNILLMDEGVGVHAVKAFQQQYRVPDYVEIVDGGAAGLDLLPFIDGREKLLMVDAVNFDREPGYIDILQNDAIPAKFGVKASLHHLGLMDVLSIVKLSDTSPKDICLIGIQPKNMELGLDMTPEIWDKINALVERMVSKLREWNVPCALLSPPK
ncbi:MAG TPA: HyaD/HybD family hydrogenase maturation endopeptidase [Nitrospirota bacterium]